MMGEGKLHDIGQWPKSFKCFRVHNAKQINQKPSNISAFGINFSKTYHYAFKQLQLVQPSHNHQEPKTKYS